MHHTVLSVVCLIWYSYVISRDIVVVIMSRLKRQMGRPRRRWVDNIMMDLQEVGCGYMDRLGLAQDRDRWRTLVSAVMNLRVPWNAGNFLTSCKPVSCSRRTLHRGVSKWGQNGPGYKFLQKQDIFLFSKPSRPGLGPTQPSIQLALKSLSQRTKRPVCKTGHSSESGDKIKNKRRRVPIRAGSR
jgi:hypothetical protein